MSAFYKRLDEETGTGDGPGGAMSQSQKWLKKGPFRSGIKSYVWIPFRNSGARIRKNSTKCEENSQFKYRAQAYFVP